LGQLSKKVLLSFLIVENCRQAVENNVEMESEKRQING